HAGHPVDAGPAERPIRRSGFRLRQDRPGVELCPGPLRGPARPGRPPGPNGRDRSAVYRMDLDGPRAVTHVALIGAAFNQVSFYEEFLHGTYVVAQAVFARAIGGSARLSSGPCPAAADAEAFARITRGSSSPQSHRPGRLRHGPAPRPAGRGGFAR